MMLLSSLAFHCMGQGRMQATLPDTDTVRVMKEYSIDSMVLSTSRQQMINGCWKELEYRQFVESGNLALERTTRYATGKNNTCDFTPYIEHNRVYKNKKLYREYSRQAACAECEAHPCGLEKQWNPSGKIASQRSYGKCGFKPLVNKRS
ncbi:hypothetical protein ACTJIJ_13075 [Niabella sp. 22666]|uniref:hypothetical protein n=1 Tax=Niabella sp. 22666 TaxID=3453954 RepID=UPI003F83A262